MFKTLLRRAPNITQLRYLATNKTYTDTHEWLHESYESTRIGLTKTAIEEFGELRNVEFLWNKGDIVDKNDDLIIIKGCTRGVNVTHPIKAPYDCIILGNNINLSAYWFGWREERLDITVLYIKPECANDSWLVKIDKLY